MTNMHHTQVGPIGPLPSQSGCLQVRPFVTLFLRMAGLWLDFLSTLLAPLNLLPAVASDVVKWVSTLHGFAGTPLDVVYAPKPMRPQFALITSPDKGQLRGRMKLTNRCMIATLTVGLLRNHEPQYSIRYSAFVRQTLGPPPVCHAIELSPE